MKRYLLSAVCMVLASTAWAQAPAAPAAQRETIITVGTIVPSGVVATTEAATGHCGKNGCSESCPKTKTVCVSEPTTVVKTKVLFSSECETKCLKKCALGKGKDCGSCQENCGRPIQVRSLYKKVCKTECPDTKCVPVQKEVCAASKCAHPGAATCSAGLPGDTTTVITSQPATTASLAPLAIATPAVPTATPTAVRPTGTTTSAEPEINTRP
jgi:hypothetical protein